jgi:hypothetical protein
MLKIEKKLRRLAQIKVEIERSAQTTSDLSSEMAALPSLETVRDIPEL